jgi:hypothetical protein
VRNWEVQVQFKVTGTTKVSPLASTLHRSQDLFGDGFAFWYSRERMVDGPVFGSKVSALHNSATHCTAGPFFWAGDHRGHIQQPQRAA